jgi:leader peptidase (prepilin peptidase)/N-methyltransferase
LFWADIMVWLWLLLVFLLGAAVGSFLNVCIYRVPLEKSIFWPGSRCGHCYQPIRGLDNIPLLSYWLLRGRCRTCRAPFSPRYFLIELLTAASFVGLFHLEVVVNVNSLVYVDWELPPALARAVRQAGPAGPNRAEVTVEVERLRQVMLRYQRSQVERGLVPWRAWVAFLHHAVLLSFLIVATFCDLDRREIPLAITGPGTVIGLIGAVLLPWPWPYSPEVATAAIAPEQAWWQVNPAAGPLAGLYPWPVWGPLPDGLDPGGNWQTGLATGLVGLLVGTLMLRTVRFLFSKGLGVEALGLGDADLMMMAGAFLGWQPVVAAFFVAVLPALVVGVVQLVIYGDNALPFGPSLAMGVVITWLCWGWIGPPLQILFFHGMFISILGAFACVFMLVASYVLRLFRRPEE